MKLMIIPVFTILLAPQAFAQSTAELSASSSVGSVSKVKAVAFKPSQDLALSLDSNLLSPSNLSPFSANQAGLIYPAEDGAQFRIPESYLGSAQDYRFDVAATYDVAISDSIQLTPYGKVSISEGLGSDTSLNNHRVSALSSSISETAYGFGANLRMNAHSRWGGLSPFASLSAEQKNAYYQTGDIIDQSKRFSLGLGFQAEFSKRAKAFMSYENSISTQLEDQNQQINAGFQFDY